MECDPYARRSDPKIPIGLLYLAAMLLDVFLLWKGRGGADGKQTI